MLSICIPIFNFDASALLSELSDQTKKLNFPSEIIVIDDGSTFHRESNIAACKTENYIQLDQNIGRSKIRNLFLKYAKFEYLLFLDCDAQIISKNFISNYINSIGANDSLVVCGGRIYPEIKPKRKYLLRWEYGIKKESQPYLVRQQFSNKSFMTNNFLIQKKLLQQIKFDERLSSYGHEDTLFGYSLLKNNIKIAHIDNPILNGDVEENAVYLAKTEQGILNLIQITEYVNNAPELTQQIRLLHFYDILKKRKLTPIIRILFSLSGPLVKFLLTKGIFQLWMFDFYKLGYFVQHKDSYR